MLKAHVDLHIARKLTHNLGVLTMFLIHHYCSTKVSWIVLLSAAIPLIIFDLLRQKIESLRVLTPKLFGAIMRRRELNGLAGTTYLFIGVGFIFYFFPKNIVSLSLLFLAFADPLASFFGLKFGSLKVVGKKTLEGSLAAFIVCTIISMIFFTTKNIMTDHLIVASLLAGIIAALTELIPIGPLDDNLTQPLLSAPLLYGLFFLFGGLGS